MNTKLGLLLRAGLLCAGTLSAEEVAIDDGNGRTALALTPPEKAYVLLQMRQFVESIQIIVAGLADGDKAPAIEAAAARGLKRNQNDPAFPSTLGAKLPQEWKQFGGSTRKGFDALADAISKSEDAKQPLKQLSEVMKNCVGCHASYRVADAKP
ncbi:cytochrome c [Methyloferula stellata]|uniref:cytochrome c n=1 Tax=Methyloferula stellata TaxID=876270 RepID=UPI0012695E39|nr:cytochrome c [Methyloferula stellata]